MAVLPEVKKHYGELRLFINGEWIASKSGKMESDPNPATGEVIAEFPTEWDGFAAKFPREPSGIFFLDKYENTGKLYTIDNFQSHLTFDTRRKEERWLKRS